MQTCTVFLIVRTKNHFLESKYACVFTFTALTTLRFFMNSKNNFLESASLQIIDDGSGGCDAGV